MKKLKVLSTMIIIMITTNITIKSYAANYKYDELNRLVEVNYGNGQKVIYSYDAGGNMLLVADNQTPTTLEVTSLLLDSIAYTISVKEKHDTMLTAVYANGTTAQLTTGVTYKSSNSAVVTVDSDGTIAGISKGNETITAEYEGKTVSAIVNVNPAPSTETPTIPSTEPVVEDDDEEDNGSTSVDETKRTPIEEAEETIQEITSPQKEEIKQMLEEYLPYTWKLEQGLSVEQLKVLTNNKFTDEALKSISENPEMLKQLGIDTSKLSSVNTLTPIENPEFKDVKPSHWASESIKKAAQLGIVAGMPDGSFDPDRALEVADTFTFLDRVLLLNQVTKSILPRSTVEKYIKDKDHWAFYSVASVGSKLSEETLKTISALGNKPLSRELLAQVLYEVTKGMLKETKEVPYFTDTKNSSYREAIDYCVSVGLLYGTSNTTMSPQKALTRAEMMAIAVRLNDLLK